MAKILCVDDEVVIRDLLVRILTRAGHEVTAVEGVLQAVQSLAASPADLVLTDWSMPGLTGIDLLQLFRDEGIETPVVMLTAFGSIEHAVEAIRAGAVNYIAKPFSPEQLDLAVQQALELVRLRSHNAKLLREAAAWRNAREIIGTSPAMRRLMQLVTSAAASRATVLLEGESGTGKELLAQAIHEQSDRAHGPFIRINCAALPDGLVESTLFGHERGAFTGALRRTAGAFERAHGGTLLLDEISEMQPTLQAKLLRAIQEREFERVGGTHPIKVDIRIIATTNRDLAAAVKAGQFREDLYYRLSVFPIPVPALRDRREDIPALAFRFASRAAADGGKAFDGITPEAIDLLQAHGWPGNVRELQHAVERAVILANEPMLGAHLFKPLAGAPAATLHSREPTDGAAPSMAVTIPTLDLTAVERHVIAEALRVSGGNRTRAAALLGIDLRTLRRKLNRPNGQAGDGPEGSGSDDLKPAR